MEWKKVIKTPFIFTPLLGLLMGNYSLGAILAGLTVLIWGFEIGMNFISLTTLTLVILTGNINLEIIFIFVISTAFLIREERLFPYLDKRILFLILSVIFISLYPVWGYLLGSIPASLLNDINIAGQVLVITGIFLTVLRGKILIEDGVKIRQLVKFVLIFLTAIIGLLGSYLLIPTWLAGSYILNLIEEKRLFKGLSTIHYSVILYLAGSIAAYVLLPIGFFLSIALITLFSFLWKKEQIPLLEMVYFSVVIGILAGRMGLLI